MLLESFNTFCFIHYREFRHFYLNFRLRLYASLCWGGGAWRGCLSDLTGATVMASLATSLAGHIGNRGILGQLGWF
jgi:hypothetical protein